MSNVSGKIVSRLKELGIELPEPAKPLAAYVPAVQAGEWVYVSGQLPFVEGKLAYVGLLGTDLDGEAGYAAARLCCLNALATLNDLLGDLDRIERIVKVTGFVASAPGFIDQPKVINGASELLAQVFGDAGRHARAAVGAAVLPLNAPVEVELIAKVRE
jgi:enamine deaminase RidA (YjgF/YER057c/UK114 family)